MPLSCAICEERKEKRFCPAVHGKICPQCCGEQRERTLDCPSECSYLLQSRQQSRQQARENAKERPVQARNEKPGDGGIAMPEVEIPEVEIDEQFVYEHQELVLGLGFALAKSARADRSLVDCDLIAALSSLAKSYQTLVNSNLIYEPPTANLAQQAIAREVESMVREFREEEQRRIGLTRLRDSEVLKALVFLIRMGAAQNVGQAEVAGVPRFPVCDVSGKALGHRGVRRGREPDRDSVELGSEAANRLPFRQRRQKFARSFPEFGMAYVRSDFDQRFENKTAQVHGRMRNVQVRLMQDAIAKQHEVDIDIARAFGAHTETSHGRFDPQRQLEQLARRLIGCNRGHAVQKPGLVGKLDGLGLIE